MCIIFVMSNVKLLKRIIPLLREGEELRDIPKKCVGNFLYIFVSFFFIFLLLEIASWSLLTDIVLEGLKGFSFSDFVIGDLCLFFGLLMSFVAFFAAFLPLYYTLKTFFTDKIVFTNQRLLIVHHSKIDSIELEEISPLMYVNEPEDMLNKFLSIFVSTRGYDCDYNLDKLWVRNVKIITKDNRRFVVPFYHPRKIYKGICEM